MFDTAHPYPRDLVGYGAKPPDPAWPGGARIAVSLVLNYEEGAEYNVLHGDAHSESALTDMDRPAALPGERNPNVEQNFEYGSRVGVWSVMRLLRERGVDATVYAVGMALERNPAVAAAFRDWGVEVACHGQRWIDYQFVPEAVERADMVRCIDTITRLVGRRPVGWYTGRPSLNTRRLAVEAGGFLYDSDAYNDDLPYFTTVGGTQHLVVPYSQTYNDSQGSKNPNEFFDYITRAFDELWREGAQGAPKMMSIGLHPRLAGQAARTNALRAFIEHAQSHEKVWFARRGDIADWWLAHHGEFPLTEDFAGDASAR